jgi:uncharacterized membrane protein
VGDYADVNGNIFGFSRSQTGKFTTIEFLPGETIVSGINNLGHVVGNSSEGEGFHGDTSGNITAVIYVPDSRYTDVYGINDLDQIVGFYVDASNVEHGFLRDSDGTFITIDLPGAQDLILTGINKSGEIVGNYIDSELNFQSFLLSPNGQVTLIVENGAAETHAYGINNQGEIVGYTVGPYPNYTRSGFLLSSNLTTFTPINDPTSGSTTRPNGINDYSEIVGGIFSIQTNSSQSGFIASPLLLFAGTPGKPNCHGQSVSALAQQYGGLAAAAAALGYSSVSMLQNAITTYCAG